MTMVFFDLDGVLVHECGVAEYGYAFLLQLLIDPQFDQIKPSATFFSLVTTLRPQIKGLHPMAKVEIIYKNFNISDVQQARFPPAKAVQSWYDAQRKYIIENYPTEKYVIQATKDLIRRIKEIGIVTASLTANEVNQAHWLLGYAGVELDFIFGYDLDKPDLTLKQDLPKEFLSNNQYKNVFVIGDGVPDVKAGNILGKSIGIGWGKENMNNLREAGAGFLSDGVEVDKIIDYIKEEIE